MKPIDLRVTIWNGYGHSTGVVVDMFKDQEWYHSKIFSRLHEFLKFYRWGHCPVAISCMKKF